MPMRHFTDSHHLSLGRSNSIISLHWGATGNDIGAWREGKGTNGRGGRGESQKSDSFDGHGGFSSARTISYLCMVRSSEGASL
jgi:hypothetical protein